MKNLRFFILLLTIIFIAKLSFAETPTQFNEIEMPPMPGESYHRKDKELGESSLPPEVKKIDEKIKKQTEVLRRTFTVRPSIEKVKNKKMIKNKIKQTNAIPKVSKLIEKKLKAPNDLLLKNNSSIKRNKKLITNIKENDLIKNNKLMHSKRKSLINSGNIKNIEIPTKIINNKKTTKNKKIYNSYTYTDNFYKNLSRRFISKVLLLVVLLAGIVGILKKYIFKIK